MCSPSRTPSHLPLHPLPLGFPSAPGPRACLMHPTWAGDLFHPRYYAWFFGEVVKCRVKRGVAKAVISGSRSSYLKCPLSWTASPPAPSHILFVVTSFLVFLVMLASHSVTAHTMVRGTLHSSSAVLGVCMRVCVCACTCG